MLPDAVTELDLFAPLPDPEDLLRDDIDQRGPGKDPTLLDYGASQFLPDTQTPKRQREKRMMELDDMDLGLDLGLDNADEHLRSPAPSDERSIEHGRRAQTPRRDEPTLLDNDDLGLDFGLDGDTTMAPQLLPDNDMPMLDADDGAQSARAMDDDIAVANEAALAKAQAAAEQRQRHSASPLSSMRPSMERDLEQTFRQTQLDSTEDALTVQAAHRVKRRKIMQPDNETQLHNTQIKKQQDDRSAITKAPSFLPRDPLLLHLMEMQRSGNFVSNLMGDGRMAGWAPELRGIMSLEVVRQAGEQKRKWDSGVADVNMTDEGQEIPQLEVPADDDEGFQATSGAVDGTRVDDHTMLMSDGVQAADDHRPPQDDDDGYVGSPAAPFDTTEAPLLHPSQSGPVSLGTKHAVHLLRDHFAPHHPKDAPEPPTPSKRVTSDALFTDICPERVTSRQDATKMFFELLVLGTKDAIKANQESSELGLPIRVRGKRGLWGDWAEQSAGGEVASQTQPSAMERPV